MKICNQCKQKFEDSAAFCPNCGKPLTAYREETVTQTRQDVVYEVSTKGNGGALDNFKKQILALEAQPEGYKRWLGTIMVVLGFVVSWYLNGIIGAAIAITGMFAGWWSQNGINKAISMIVGSITVFISIFALFL